MVVVGSEVKKKASKNEASVTDRNPGRSQSKPPDISPSGDWQDEGETNIAKQLLRLPNAFIDNDDVCDHNQL